MILDLSEMISDVQLCIGGDTQVFGILLCLAPISHVYFLAQMHERWVLTLTCMHACMYSILYNIIEVKVSIPYNNIIMTTTDSFCAWVAKIW